MPTKLPSSLLVISACLLFTACGEKIEEVPTEIGPDFATPKAMEEVPGGTVYEEPYSGISLIIPDGAIHDSEEPLAKPAVYINAWKVESLDGPNIFSKETAIESIEALENGTYGPSVDFAVKESEKVIDIDGKNGKEYITLARFEVCDTAFDRILIFYNNGYQIILSVSAPQDLMKDVMPQYFTKNEENCGDMLIWDFDEKTMEAFVSDLSSGDVPDIAKEWYELFDTIVSSIELN